METAGLPEPVYRQTDFMLYATLKNKNYGTGSSWADTAHEGAHDTAYDRAQDEAYDKYELIVAFCDVKRTKQEIMDYMRFSSKRQFNERYMKPLLQSGRLRMTLPDKPKSKNQKYISTKSELEKAQAILDNNPVLAYSPGDLRQEGRTVEEYLATFTDSEQEFYRDYYEDEI